MKTNFLRIYSADSLPARQTAARFNFHAVHTADYFQVRAGEQSLDVRLRKRTNYPRTYCSVKPNHGLWLGYGPRYPQNDDEFLRIHIAPSGTIRIERDMYCTLPLFYGFSGGVFVVSNFYDEVCSSLPRLTPVPAVVRHNLWALFPHSQTMWQEVGILGPRQTLLLANGALKVIDPPPRSWKYRTELMPADPRDFASLLESQLERFMTTRFGSSTVGFELSGGMDSSLLPLYLAKQGYDQSLPAGTMLLPRPHYERHAQKITTLENCTPTRIHRVVLDPVTHNPLRSAREERPPKPQHILHALYDTAIEQIAAHLQQQGVTVVARGVGGDQLFEHIPHAASYEPAAPNKPPPFFLGDYSGAEVILHNTDKGLLPLSQPLEQLGAANIYIERDIWPVSPFHDAVLYEFCQALPFTFRRNKTIFRAYFAANRFPEILYTGSNESFEHFFNLCLSQPFIGRLVDHYATHAVTRQLGAVDTDKLRQSYARACAGDFTDDTLLAVYSWLRTEIDLQAQLEGFGQGYADMQELKL